jgi:hypothetical protein
MTAIGHIQTSSSTEINTLSMFENWLTLPLVQTSLPPKQGHIIIAKDEDNVLKVDIPLWNCETLHLLPWPLPHR